MTSQTLNIGNFGEAGYLPDVAPSLLPQNGFSFSRNWRFNKGGHAEVSAGYTNAFDTRGNDGDPFILGDENSDLTFLYTWELSNENAVAVYDATSKRMLFIENDSATGLSEYNLSVENVTQYSLEYTDGTPTTDQFTVNSNNELVIEFADVAAKDLALLSIVDGYEMSIVDTSRKHPISDVLVVGTPVELSNSLTVTLALGLNASDYIAGDSYFLRFAEILTHADEAEYRWEGTNALGIPVFNNEVEEPWEFVDAEIPFIRPMTNFPTGGLCKSLTSFGAVLVAVGYTNVTADAAFQGSDRVLAFSNPITTAGTFPLWDFSNADSEASIVDLSLFTDGVLQSGFETNNQLIINSTTDVISVTDTGGGSYDGTKLEIGGGVLTKRSSVAIANGFFSIGNGQFYIHDTNTYQSIGHGLYSDSWFSSIDEGRLSEVQVIYDPRTRSVWIKTPTSEVAQEIWVINLENNYTLDVLDDHQEIKYLEWSAEGTPAESTTWDSIPVDTWEEVQQNSWNEFPVVELGDYRNRILGCGGREVYVHDFGPTYNGRAIDALLEKSYFKLGASDSYSTFQFDRVVPWVEGNTDAMIDIRVGKSNSLGSPITNTAFKTYTIGTSEKLDFRTQAKWGSITFRCQTSGVELSGVEITVNSASRR